MQFGLFGGARTKRSVGLEDSQGYQSFIDYVTEADRARLKQLFMVEHHFTGQGQVSASMTVLAYLAARTQHIRLGTAVVVLPWHNPVLIAEQVATLDLLTGGRVDFGVGKGYRKAEFDGFCIPIDEATERFDEAMEIIRKAWTTEGRFCHHGKRWHYENIVVEPEPLQRPHPPLWLAAGSHDSIRRAAREGYNLLLDQLAQTDQIIERIAIFREECGQIGRAYDPHMVATARPLQMFHHESERAAAYETRKRVVSVIGDLARDKLADRVEDDTAPLLGTPEEVIARLKELEAGGATNILLVDPNASVANLRAFAREVMPSFSATAFRRGRMSARLPQAAGDLGQRHARRLDRRFGARHRPDGQSAEGRACSTCRRAPGPSTARRSAPGGCSTSCSELEVRSVFYVSGILAERYPDLMKAIAGAGHAVAAHGWGQNIIPSYQTADEEAHDLQRCVKAIEQSHRASAARLAQPALHAERAHVGAAGEIRVSTGTPTSSIPTCPTAIDTPGGAIAGVPFTMEVNDMPLYVRYGAEPEAFTRTLERIVGNWPRLGLPAAASTSPCTPTSSAGRSARSNS